LIAFLVIFIVVYIIVKIIEKILHGVLEKIHLDKLDKSLGFLLGIVEGLLVFTVILLILKVQPFFDLTHVLEGSFAARVILQVLPFTPEELSIEGLTESV